MPFTPPEINLYPLLPALIPAVTAIVVMLADVLLPGKSKSWLSFVALVGLGLAAYFTFTLYGPEQSAFNNAIVTTNLSLGVSLVILVAAFITILLSIDYLNARQLDFGEYLALLLGAT